LRRELAHEGQCVAARQPGQLDDSDVVAAEHGCERLEERPHAMRLSAGRENRQSVPVGPGGAYEEVAQRKRGVVDPLEVVGHYDDGCELGDATVDGFEEVKRFRGSTLGGAGSAGEHLLQTGPVALGLAGLAHETASRRQRDTSLGLISDHGDDACRAFPRQRLVEQPALARARIADDGRDGRYATAPGSPKDLSQDRKLGLPPDEARHRSPRRDDLAAANSGSAGG
jgi:hypothetical protein